MENSAPVIFAFTPPILYATTAVVITAAAVVFGYLYTQKASKDVSREVAGDTTNTKQQDGQVKSSGVETDNKEASVLSGSWPSNADGKKDESAPERDPVEFCSHLQSEVKRTQQKVAIQKIEEEMTPEQKENEREIQHQQLESIFKLMHSQEEKFGVDSMEDIQSQMKLYM